MTGTQERFIGDSRDLPVNDSPLLPEISIQDRREQRVGEANRPARTLDHVGRSRRLERVRCNTRPSQERLRGCAEGRGERERLARRGGEIGDPCAQELVERFGDRQRLERIRVFVEDATKLEREERIPA
jgi:hypothetical protein